MHYFSLRWKQEEIKNYNAPASIQTLGILLWTRYQNCWDMNINAHRMRFIGILLRVFENLKMVKLKAFAYCHYFNVLSCIFDRFLAYHGFLKINSKIFHINELNMKSLYKILTERKPNWYKNHTFISIR